MKKVLAIFLAIGLSAGLMAGQEVAVKSKKTTTFHKVKKVLTSKPVKVAAGVALLAASCYAMFRVRGYLSTLRRSRGQNNAESAPTAPMLSEEVRQQWRDRASQATEENKDALLEEFLGFLPADLRDCDKYERQAIIESGQLILRFKSNPRSRSFWERWSSSEQLLIYSFPLSVDNVE